MKNGKILLERFIRKIVEDRNKKIPEGESWFYENPCILRQFPSIKVDGFVASHEASNRIWNIERNGLLTITIRPEGADENRYGDAYLYGKWWCNPTTKKFEFKMNSDGKPTIPNKTTLSLSQSSPIPQAKTMDDVKNKTGFVIKGMRGPVVKELQQMLLNLGYDLGPSKDDSIFGDKTLEAITDFQKKSSIRPKNNKFGIFGSLTLEKMNQAIAQK